MTRPIKVVLIGQLATGKSTIAHRLAQRTDMPQQSTIGSAYMTTTLTSPAGIKFQLNLWDTAGSEKYRSIMPMYVRNADIVLAVYDVTDYASLDRIREDRAHYIDTVADIEHAIWILIGNKCDLGASSSLVARARELANEWTPRGQHFRASALNATGINDIAEYMGDQLQALLQLQQMGVVSGDAHVDPQVTLKRPTIPTVRTMHPLELLEDDDTIQLGDENPSWRPKCCN